MSHDFLFATWEGGGNVPPVLGAVRRLTGRGHRVRVLADEAIRRALVALLGDPDHAAAAARLGAAIAKAESATALIDELEALATCGTRRVAA